MQVNLNFKKWNFLFKFNYAYSFLLGMLGAMLIILITDKIQVPKKIVTVNVTQIIKQFTVQEAKKDVTEAELKQKTMVFVKQLEKTIQLFAFNNHLVIVPKEAVFAGSEDYTDIITQAMRDQ